MNYLCKICGAENPEKSHFYKKHKITIKEYFQKNYPKNDLYDNSPIEFKGDIETYLSKDFNSKGNLGKWLSSVSPERYTRYVKEFLINRKNTKNLIYSPTQIELKTLSGIPGINWINNHIGNYYDLCKELGFINRFNKYNFDKTQFIDISKKVIFKDTREKLPLNFNNNTVRNSAINVGDYRMAGSEIRIERKSFNDYYSTMSGGYERFLREIERAKEQNLYLIILVEKPFNHIYSFFSEAKKYYNKIIPASEYVLHNMRSILEKYNHVQIVFVENRSKASEMIEFLFSADKQCKEIDVQLYIDSNKEKTL